MARSIFAGDLVRKTHPLDNPPLVIDAVATPPTLPLEVRPRDRVAYIFDGASYNLQTTGDYVHVTVTGVVARPEDGLRVYPFAIHNSNYCTFIYINGGSPDPSNNVGFGPYPYTLEAGMGMTHGETYNFPPDFYASEASFIWNFKLTRLNTNVLGNGQANLEVWRTGDAGNLATTLVYVNTEPATGFRVLVGNPEAMSNTYIPELVAPVGTTIVNIVGFSIA